MTAPAPSSSGRTSLWRSTPDRLVLRSSSSLWIVAVLGALMAFLLGDAVLRGQPLVAVRWLPWLALGLWVFYALLVRPCVIVTGDRLELVNIVRRHTIPWSAVDHLESRYQLRVLLVDGTALRSWGAPSAGLDRAPRAVRDASPDGITARPGRSRAALPPVDLVISRWREAALERRPGADTGSREPATTRVELRVILIPAALVVLGLLASLLV